MTTRSSTKRTIASKGTVSVVLAIGFLAGIVAFAQNGTAINPDANNVLTVAAYGDSPYGLNPTDTTQTDKTLAFIESINNDPKVDLVLHVGDIHSGKQFCTEAYDRTFFDLWTAFKNPLIYTPGDNEWTDCHKAGEGGHVHDAAGNPVDYADGDPIANLDLVRSIFFASPGYSLGGRKKQLLTQALNYDPAGPDQRDEPAHAGQSAMARGRVHAGAERRRRGRRHSGAGRHVGSGRQGRLAPLELRAVHREHCVARPGVRPARSAPGGRLAPL